MAPKRPSRAEDVETTSSPQTTPPSSSQTIRDTSNVEPGTSQEPNIAPTLPRRGSKFQPKSAVRRSQLEREAQEKAESDRQKARHAEAARAAVGARARGGRAGGRGRGDFRGGLSSWRHDINDRKKQFETKATGFLGSGVASTKVPSTFDHNDGDVEITSSGVVRRDVSGAGRGSSNADKTAAKRIDAEALTIGTSGSRRVAGGNASGTADAKTKVKKEEDLDGIMIDDEEEEDAKININIDELAYINLISDDDEEYDTAGNPRRSFNPIRMIRKQHSERKQEFESTVSLETPQQVRKEAKGKGVSEIQALADEDDGVSSQIGKAKSKGKSKRGRGVQHIDEFETDRVKQEDDGAPPTSVTEFGPYTADDRIDVDMFDENDPEDLLPHRNKARRKYPPLFSKPLLQTAEDHEEWKRHQTDMHAIAEELGNEAFQDTASRSTAGPSFKTKSETKGRRDNKVYLFQLPPIMPNLCTKAEADQRTQEVDPETTTAMPAPAEPRPDKGKKAVRDQNNSAQETAVKVEDEHKEDIASISAPFQPALTASMTPTFKGPVGTLTVYESGATELDWGGIGFELDRGMGSMLQETILIDDELGVANSMSQVVASFVLKPNWDDLFEAEG